MKINLTKFSLSLLAALTLAACGSGGGGGSEPSKQNPAPVQPQPQPQPQPDKDKAEQSGKTETKPKPDQDKPNADPSEKTEIKPEPEQDKPNTEPSEKPEQKPLPQINNATDATISGESYRLESEGNDDSIPLPITKFDGQDINYLYINNQKVPLIPNNSRDGQFPTNNNEGNDNVRRLIAGFANTSWGHMVDQVHDPKHFYVFAIGHNATKTENLPEGSATYSGNAIHITPHASDVGATKFNVNFADKSVDGKITFKNKRYEDIILKATISGNGFEGLSQDGTLTKGGFYGDKAQELIGTYKNDNPNSNKDWYIGAYGTKKDTDK